MKQRLFTTRRGPEVIIILKVRLMVQIYLASRYNELHVYLEVDFNATLPCWKDNSARQVIMY